MNVQTFTPDNVPMLQNMSGSVPIQQGTLIIGDVMQNSAVMQVARFEEMTALEKEFDVFLGGIGAYWVAEGERIQTSRPQWTKVKMEAKKLGVILPVSREYLHYKQADFFEKMRPQIAQAFYRKFDSAVLFNLDNPFKQSVAESIIDTSNTVEGDINVENLDTIVGMLNDAGYEPSAYISKIVNNSAIKAMVRDENGLLTRVSDGSNIDGVPIVNVDREIDVPKGTLLAGDFDMLRYGIPYTMSYKISEDATLTTVVDEEGHPLGLFERELVALRVTMDIGMMIIQDEAFASITPVVVP